MEILLGFAQLIGPTLVGLLVVPLLAVLKNFITIIDSFPAPVQQILAVLIAWGLTQLGVWASVMLPAELSLFTGHELEALLSAALAIAVHAGGKAKG